MSRLPRRTYLLAPAVAIAAGLSLTACGDNGVAVQSREHNTSDGIEGQVGNVLVRNAQLTLGGNGVALLGVALFNDGSAADALTGLASPDATGFTLPTQVTASPGAYGGASPSDTRNVASAAAGAAPAAQQGASSITLPSKVGVFLDTGLTQITVTGLPPAAAVGQSIPISFTFQGAGTLLLQVPITGAASTGTVPSPLPTVSDAGAAAGPPTSTPPTAIITTVYASATPTAHVTPPGAGVTATGVGLPPSPSPSSP